MDSFYVTLNRWCHQGVLRCRTSPYVESTREALRHSFPKVVQINCHLFARYGLGTGIAQHASSIQIRASRFIDRANIKPWSHISCVSYRTLPQHIATLPHKHWVQRILPWCVGGAFRIGVAHDLIGNPNLNRTAGRKASDDGPMVLWIGTFGINIANFSWNFTLKYKAIWFKFVPHTSRFDSFYPCARKGPPMAWRPDLTSFSEI